MKLDLENERLIPLREVARMFPGRTGRGVSMATVWRWVTHGRRGVRLAAIFVGGARYSSRSAVERWIIDCNRAVTPHPVGGDDDRVTSALNAEGI